MEQSFFEKLKEKAKGVSFRKFLLFFKLRTGCICIGIVDWIWCIINIVLAAVALTSELWIFVTMQSYFQGDEEASHKAMVGALTAMVGSAISSWFPACMGVAVLTERGRLFWLPVYMLRNCVTVIVEVSMLIILFTGDSVTADQKGSTAAFVVVSLVWTAYATFIAWLHYKEIKNPPAEPKES